MTTYPQFTFLREATNQLPTNQLTISCGRARRPAEPPFAAVPAMRFRYIWRDMGLHAENLAAPLHIFEGIWYNEGIFFLRAWCP